MLKAMSSIRAGAFALAVLMWVPDIAPAQVEVMPERSTYRYLISPNRTNPSGAEDPEFDDSAFSSGAAPFGLSIGGITWGIFEGLAARCDINLNGAPTGAVLNLRLIGYGSFYINGVPIGTFGNCGGSGSDYQTIPICDGILRQGDNLFAAVCIASCGGAYFDASITAAGGATRQTSDTWGELKLRYR